tara:strand:- start:11913 stop:13202 length:1290 start_codon:yes stop_codon:yes gene_type:complete
MRLKSIQIQNFRCFDDLTVEFEKDLSVVVAVNGGGKTALLDAIAAAFLPVSDNLGNDTQRGVISLTKDIRFPEEKEKLNLALEMVGGMNWVLPYQLIKERESDDLPIRLEMEIDYQMFDMRSRLYENPDSKEVIPVLAYYRSSRNFTKDPQATDKNQEFLRLDVWNTALDAAANYQDVIDWCNAKEIEELRKFKVERKIAPSVALECVRQAVTSILEPAQSFYFTATTPSVPALQWLDNGGPPNERLVSQLSDGYRNILALVMDFARRLAQANPQLPNPLESEAIMLVDEVDLHLHPKWQQTIIADLQRTFPNTQFIVTTHSPQVLTTVESRCIRILEDGKVRHAPPASQGAESVRMLERIMKVDSRPPGIGKTEQITELMQLISDNQLDEAQKLLAMLQEWSQGEEPALDDAEMAIENRRWEEALPKE